MQKINKKLNPVVTELSIRSRTLNIAIVFITQSYFKVPKDVRLNSTHEEIKMNNLGDYRDLYVRSNTSLLGGVFKNFRNKCIEIYELDPAFF